MIDGRGKARVTDFGIAVVANELLGAQAASGTPAYMAPEQLKGKEVTQKSDIYSLGLVLYELFTGKRVYDSDNLHELMKLHETSSPTSPSSHVEHIDPLVERVIMRCLEKEPNKRPATAIQVAAALPGGDPLAAALAAGETPSPEMVAASGEKTGLRPAIAVALLAAIVGALAIALVTARNVDWPAILMREYSPADLTHKAQDIIQRLGYAERPADSASGMGLDTDHLQYIRQNSEPGNSWGDAMNDQPAALFLWYRRSPRYLIPTTPDSFGWILENDPPNGDVSGMVSVRLDPKGRLIYFKAVPPQVDAPDDKPSSPDWTVLFSAAGLDPASFASTESTWVPGSGFDTRAAWTGTYPDQRAVPIRIEAAAYRGKLTYFDVIAPWKRPSLQQDVQRNTGDNIASGVVIGLFLTLLIGAVLLARRNLKKGRGDRRGATRLSFFVFATAMLGWVIGADHRLTFDEVPIFLAIALSQTLFLMGLVWLLYIALEPYVRRRWPETIISWSRLLAGSLRDPLIGRDVLIGILAGLFMMVLYTVQSLIRAWSGATPGFQNLSYWLGTRQFIAAGILTSANVSVLIGLLFFFLIFLLRILTRRGWIAILVFAAVLSLPSALGGDSTALMLTPLEFLVNAFIAFICVRFGLLTVAVAFFIENLSLVNNFSPWFTSYLIAQVIFVLALAGWAFNTSLGGQKVFSGNLLED
jgi:serine/threonine-protein kinase